MPNPTISTITLPSGSTYDICDSTARAAAEAAIAAGGQHLATDAASTPYGVKWMSGSTEITGTLVASATTKGVYYVPSPTEDEKDNKAEYITLTTGTESSPVYTWEKIGNTIVDLSGLGALAYKDSASALYAPAGTVSQPTFTGTTKKLAFSGATKKLAFSGASMTSTGNFTPGGTININASTGSGTSYTPEGTITTNTTGTGTSIKPSGTVSQPTFTGTTKYLKFSGTSGNVSVTGNVSGAGSVEFVTGLSALTSETTGTIKVLKGASINNSSGTSFPITGSIEVNATTGSGTSYTPAGSISVNDSSGSGTAYTPAGTVSTPTISVKTAGSTTSVTPFGSAGTLPSLSMTVQDGNLTIGFDQGTLPSAGTAVTVKTGDAAYQSTQPTFTGTQKKLAFSGTAKKLNFVGNAITVGINEEDTYLAATTASKSVTFSASPTLTGSFTPSGTISVDNSSSSGATAYTPAGTVSQPTFSGDNKYVQFSGTAKKFAFQGTQGSVSVSGTPGGTINVNDSSGSGTSYTPAGTINVNASSGSGTSYTPEGTVSQPSFSGTVATITVS